MQTHSSYPPNDPRSRVASSRRCIARLCTPVGKAVADGVDNAGTAGTNCDVLHCYRVSHSFHSSVTDSSVDVARVDAREEEEEEAEAKVPSKC